MRWTEGRAAPSVRRFPEEPGEGASGAHQWVLARHARAILRGRLQVRALWDHPVFDETPEGNHQLSGDRHDADATAPPAGRGEPAREPLRQGTVRLPPEPAPRDLDADPSELGAARFTNPLVLHALITAVRHRHQPRQCAELAAVAECPRP